MSDPRFTDPRYTDPRMPPQTDPAAMRRFDLERGHSSVPMWGWAAAIVVLIFVMALVIDYNRSSTVATNQSNTPTTTGAAPPAPPRTPANEAGPTITLPPASTSPADEPAPAPAPAPAQSQP